MVVNRDDSSKLLSFEKGAFCARVSGDRQTEEQINRRPASSRKALATFLDSDMDVEETKLLDVWV